MKTRIFKELLDKADPSGELEVSVNGEDIHFVETLPSYYDGSQEVLLRDGDEKIYYNIVGARFDSSGTKVVVHTMSIYDAISNAAYFGREFPVDYSDLSDYQQKRHKDYINKIIEENEEVNESIHLSAFLQWLKKRLGFTVLTGEQEDNGGESYKKLGLSHKDSLRFSSVGSSVSDKREEDWTNRLDVADDGIVTNKTLKDT